MPLVLFHGWGFDSQIWQLLLPRLNAFYQLYLVDLPGFGRTDDMTWDAFKERLLSQLPHQFAVLGWSMGGLFATRLAIEASMRVTHVLNIASSPRFIVDAHWPGVERAVFSAFYDDLKQDPHQTLLKFTTLQLPNQAIVLPSGGVAGLRAGLDVLLNWDLRAQLQDLSMPVCYLFGRLDTIVSRKLMPVMQAAFHRFQYHMIDRAAHVPFLSHTDAFVTFLDEFLQ
jgi:pimeloyl-[acyl-carrier protein] methyl ester esterase